MAFNMTKTSQVSPAKAGQQALPSDALSLTQMFNEIQAKIKEWENQLAQFNASIASQRPGGQPTPQDIDMINKINMHISQLNANKEQVYKKLWEVQNADYAQVKIQQQTAIQAILNDDQQILSQMSEQDYVQARDKFLRSAPKPRPGMNQQQYFMAVQEWMQQYNPSGDLVVPWSKRVVNEYMIRSEASRQKNQEIQARRNQKNQRR